jgi:hypothetical protein
MVTHMKRNLFLMNRITRSNQMTKHFTYSKLWTTAVALALLLGSALMLSGQDVKKRGIPKDWSMHHVVYSNPGTKADAIKNGTLAHWLKVTNDPRYIIQQEQRAADAAGLKLPVANLGEDAGPDIAPPPSAGPLPRGVNKALIPPTGREAVPPPGKHHRIHKDWSVGEGTNGTSGLGEFPATFTGTATPCLTDYAVYNTGLAGSGTQATIVGYNNIYNVCNGGAPNGPNVLFAYNTGSATVINSIDVSASGSSIAFVQGNSGSVASLVVVGTGLGGTGVTTPVSTTGSQTTVPFNAGVGETAVLSDTYSSPFYDYLDDTIYVGDDNGYLHQFTGVFLGTPTETVTGGWPKAVSGSLAALGSPVYDSNTGYVFVGDYLLNYASTCEPSATNTAGSCGYLYSVLASGPTVVSSKQLDYQYGIVDSPIVDPSASPATVYAFAGADNTTSCSSGPCAGVYQFLENFPAAAPGAEVQVGAGYEFLLSGAFDNNYITTGTGNLYVVGGTGPQNNTLYAIGITPSSVGFATTGPAVAANYTNGFYAGGLQVTEFYTGSADKIFFGVLMTAANSSVGQVATYDVTAGAPSPSAVPDGVLASQGGTSGIVVDNSMSTALNMYYSSLLNAASCTTTGSGGCAVQLAIQ